jgi:tetratricopeptide (TPR) repeat protein
MNYKFAKIGIILIIFITIFQLYLYTTYPAFKNDDSPETTTVSYTLGIGHPPSYPLFTMAGKIATLLLPGAPAFRMNIFSIILGLLTLLAAYFVLRENSLMLFGKTNMAVNIGGTLLLGVSYLFWNQAVEAKGGIYMLNLIFLSLIIYCYLRLLRKFEIKYLYLISFIFGLSLANHWPSMVVLTPVFGYVFYRFKNSLDIKRTLINILLLTAGLSAYIYLPIRADVDGVFVFMARPDTWQNFLWTVFRSGYINDNLTASGAGFGQVIEYLRLLRCNYSVLCIFAVIGGAVLWRLKRGLACFYGSIFLIISALVAVFYHAPRNMALMAGVFSLPAQYIIFILTVTGFYFIFIRLKKRYKRELLAVFAVLAVLYCGFSGFSENNGRNNYLSYDLGNNIIKTLDKGSFYIAGIDSYYMPLLYFQNVMHAAPDIRNFNTGSIQFTWGINDFIKKYGNPGLRENDVMNNLTHVIDAVMDGNTVYFTTYAKIPDKRLAEYSAKVKGILFRISKKGEYIPPGMFDLYSYRGIYDANPEYDRDIFYLYEERMAMYADELFLSGSYGGSVKMYNRALQLSEKIPDDKFVRRADIYYNLSIDYAYLSDRTDQLRSLLKTIENRCDFWQAYEDAGMIYYQDKNVPAAMEMFQKAVKYGSPDRVQLGKYMAALSKSQ